MPEAINTKARLCISCYSFRPLHETGAPEGVSNPYCCKLMPPTVVVVRDAMMPHDPMTPPVGHVIGSFHPQPPPDSSCNSFEPRDIGLRRIESMEKSMRECLFGVESKESVDEENDGPLDAEYNAWTDPPVTLPVNVGDKEESPVFESHDITVEEANKERCSLCVYGEVSLTEMPCSDCGSGPNFYPSENQKSYFKRA